MKPKKINIQWSRIQRHFIRFTWGGAWAAALPEGQRKNLTRFFFDGLFAAASDKIILTYLTVYLMTLGATRQQVGLLSSLSNFAAALILLPAAMLVEKTGEPKRVSLTAGAISRTLLIVMALLPLVLVPATGLIWVMLVLSLIRESLNNFGYPGWMILTGYIVPLAGRGRYFGTRNFVMGLSGILTALLVGQAITKIGEPLGYQFAFMLAAGLGFASTYFFARLKPPRKDQQKVSAADNSIKAILKSLKGQAPFINLCIYTAIWNFSINIAGPFFNVYMVDTLHFTAAVIGVITVGNTVANLMVQRRVGALADKWGDRKVSMIFMLLIPFVPAIWGIWVHTAWQAILTEIFSGLIWGAYNLTSFNIILSKTPEKQRARFSAIYQIVVTLSLAIGAALGSFLIPLIDFKGVTLASAAGRMLAAILFLFLVKDPPPEPETAT